MDKRGVIGIIPARMGSTRFPGKPLAKIAGKAMIHHVYERSKKSRSLEAVYVATPDLEIQDYCRCHGLAVVMTKKSHERASDRAAEAMLKIEKAMHRRVRIVVMIQGDEPMIFPEMIARVLNPFEEDKQLGVANLTARLHSPREATDPNTVKVVLDRRGFALYFSREPIPSAKKGAVGFPVYKQVPVIPFRRDFLLTFNRLTPTPLEQIESIDMLRVLEHGYRVKMVLSPYETYSVDTPADLKRVARFFR